MLGAIAGDMIGAPYEFGIRAPRRDFPLWKPQSRPTDDTVMTIAVAEALLDHRAEDEEALRAALTESMRSWGRRYPDAGYGGMFWDWLWARHPRAYGSYGNGSAMRVSSVGWLCETLDETRRIAALTASVTHNHPEGIRGAEAVAAAIFLARTGSTVDDIFSYVTGEFGYDLTKTHKQLSAWVRRDASCQRTVPAALTCLLGAEDFEDAVRAAVTLGGDTDTLAAMAGSVAEALWGIPDDLLHECERRLSDDMRAVVDRFRLRVAESASEGPAEVEPAGDALTEGDELA